MKLNPKQELFVKEYLIDFNATQAALRAGYSPKTAYSQGPRLLDNVEIQREIEKGKLKTLKKLEITREDILKKAYNIPLLYSQMLELAQRDDLEPDEELKLLRLSSLVKGSDFNKSLEILNKMLGYNEADRVDVTSGGEKITINFNTKKDD
jgi:phage terminase small subunit